MRLLPFKVELRQRIGWHLKMKAECSSETSVTPAGLHGVINQRTKIWTLAAVRAQCRWTFRQHNADTSEECHPFLESFELTCFLPCHRRCYTSLLQLITPLRHWFATGMRTDTRQWTNCCRHHCKSRRVRTKCPDSAVWTRCVPFCKMSLEMWHVYSLIIIYKYDETDIQMG
jgi:hypothetical protein